jgi:hypothetical protein
MTAFLFTTIFLLLPAKNCRCLHFFVIACQKIVVVGHFFAVNGHFIYVPDLLGIAFPELEAARQHFRACQHFQ